MCFFFSSRRRHTRYWRDWSSDVCSSDLNFGRHFFIHLEAGPEVDEEVTAEIRAVDPEAAAEPGHDEREQRPQIPVREIRGQDRKSVRVGEEGRGRGWTEHE